MKDPRSALSETDENTQTQSKHHQIKLPVTSLVPSCLLFLAIMYTLYFAQPIVVPLLFSGLIALLLNPLVNFLQRFFVPRVISTIVLLMLLITPLTLLFVELAEPAQKWIKTAPEVSANLTQKVNDLSESFQLEQEVVITQKQLKEKTEEGIFSIFGFLKKDKPKLSQTEKNPDSVVAEKLKLSGIDIAINLISATPVFLAKLLSGVVLILFLLVFGPALFDTYVQELNCPDKKQRTVKLAHTLQKQLSRYILTISTINVGLGAATALALKLIGINDPLLWGAMVCILNYLPYIGFMMGMMVLSVASFSQFGMAIEAFMPLVAYFALNLVESQLVTPTLLGRSMKINPLVVMLWLLLCAWMWGIVGVFLSVPLLVLIKLTFSQLGMFKSAVRVIESG